MGGGPLDDGVYFLYSKARNFGERADLDNGDWKWGQLQVWEANDNDNANGHRNQRYLITRVPIDNSNDEWYHVTNLFYGGLVGVYNGERNNSWKVKVAPSTTSEYATQWGFWELEPSMCSIYWRPDATRRLDVKGSEHHGDVLAWSNNSQPNQVWRVSRDITMESVGTARWMSYVPGNPKLSMLNLIGTHQSLALHAKASQGHEGKDSPSWTSGTVFSLVDNPRCQNRSPYEQMVDGVRYLDCRFSVWDQNGWATNLYAWHGANNGITGVAEGYSFTAVLQSIKLFLSRNPRETVIVSVGNEHNAAGFESAFRNDFHGYEYLFYEHDNPSKSSIHEINLDDVRGKAILLSGDDWARSIRHIFDPSAFYGNGAISYSKGNYDISRSQWDSNLQDIRNNLEAAKGDRNENHVYITSWNASKAIDTFEPGYNPIDYYQYAHDTMVDVLRQDNIGLDGQYRIGIVHFDFYELIYNETLHIIRSNPGCANVSR